MKVSRLSAAALVTCVASLPLAGAAQYSGEYTPPKLLSQGTPTSAVAGKGSVTLQVFVNANGTFRLQRILSSTNHGDDAAAREIANTSKYAPARRNGKAVSAFYTYKLNFSGAGSTASSDENASGASAGTATSSIAFTGNLAPIAAMERSGNYAGAKSALAGILQSNPNDPKANLLLGVADAFTQDAAGAAAAFDKAGEISGSYRGVAARAYLDAANSAINGQKYSDALTEARKSLALVPGISAYNVIGNADIGLKDYPGAVAAFEKARGFFPSTPSITAQQKAIIVGNLAAAYYANNQPTEGAAAAKAALALDPSQSAFENLIADVLVGRANDLRQAGKRIEAAGLLENAAAAAPKEAVALYTQAANDYASASPPDNKRARAAADRALALAPNDARANYVAGVALINDKDKRDALPYLNKANAAAKSGGDAALGAQIDAALKEAQR